MDPAFQLFAAPTAGSRIVRIVWNGRAWLAADARVSFVVLRKIAEAVRRRVFPHLRPRPICERTHFQESLAAWQAMLLHFFEVFSRWGLLSAQSGKPDLELAESLHQGFHFSQLAALRGIRAIENSKQGFLLFHRIFWKHVRQVERPLLRHAIAILVCLCKVVAGIQKQNG